MEDYNSLSTVPGCFDPRPGEFGQRKIGCSRRKVKTSGKKSCAILPHADRILKYSGMKHPSEKVFSHTTKKNLSLIPERLEAEWKQFFLFCLLERIDPHRQKNIEHLAKLPLLPQSKWGLIDDIKSPMEFKLTTSSGPAAIRANDTDGIRRGAYTLEDQLCAAAFRTYVR